MLVLADLDDATVERAGALVAKEHAAARRICPELPSAYVDAATCTGALQQLRAAGHSGIVASEGGRAVAVMTAQIRENPVTGSYARLPAEGFAVDPDLEDPTGVVALAIPWGSWFLPRLGGHLSDWLLAHMATSCFCGATFYSLQAIELLAGGLNLTLMSLNIRDGITSADDGSRSECSESRSPECGATSDSAAPTPDGHWSPGRSADAPVGARRNR